MVPEAILPNELHRLSVTKTTGTRFRLFPQPPFGDKSLAPEIVEVSSPVGSVGPGPSDDRMYVIYPINKNYAYGLNEGPLGTPWLLMPPWRKETRPLTIPGTEGHFDHLMPGSQGFEAAHLFGAVRWTLDVWEGYFGRQIPWHFASDFERLELVLLPWWDNAHVGYGFLEAGSHRDASGNLLPFSLNFDVIAHEVGHAIIYSEVGLPSRDAQRGEYFGFHESAADWVALITSLHFDSVVTGLLDETRGNLYTFNRFNRFSEFSSSDQIRLAANPLKISDFTAGWHDEHDLAQPLTGAIFDSLVDIYHETLVELGAIDRSVEELSDIAEYATPLNDELQADFDVAYDRNPYAFLDALLLTRDYVGLLLANLWKEISPDFLSYADVGDLLIDIDGDKSGGRYRDILWHNFRRRYIGTLRPGPRLSVPDNKSHAFSSRTHRPNDYASLPQMSYHERQILNNQL